jgi:hypothetical protein
MPPEDEPERGDDETEPTSTPGKKKPRADPKSSSPKKRSKTNVATNRDRERGPRDDPCQPTVLSMEKLHLVHGPSRQLLGQFPDTGPMVVAMSSRRRNKILGVIDEGKWCTRQQAGIRDLGKLDGLLINATEYHPWGRCQFFLSQNLLRNAILTQYHRTRAYRDRRGLRDRIQRQLPRELWKRTDRIVSREVATFV